MKTQNRQYVPFQPTDKRWVMVHTVGPDPNARDYDYIGWDSPVSNAHKTLSRYQNQLEAKRKRPARQTK